MRKAKYVFNDKTLQYERHKLTYRQIAYRVVSQMCAIMVTGILFYFLVAKFLPSPKEKALAQELNNLQYQLKSISSEYDKLVVGINEIHKKDNDVHRLIFGVSPIDDGVWEGGTGGHDKYAYLESYSSTGPLIKSTLEKIDKIKSKMEIQEKSLAEMYSLAYKREKKLSSVPSIKPVREDKLNKGVEMLSGFGIRLHPLHKVKKLHKGIDFTAPSGTPIQATGDGRVVKVESAGRGYGNNVTIDHGFGYKTLYAHMKTIAVKNGAVVKKGQTIGTVGSTGTSTAPHCHYEVHINGSAVNPLDYVLDGLSPKEYLELVKKASQENQSWD
ncbi:MAG: M23 family metallopeptidase [Saprospiraceae bacterium]|nr:M23 family metallopeptidase [Saprospiraceae bacterium]MBK8635305.1 M23 family metallopeptidase [Saprospiraceae bacterium]